MAKCLNRPLSLQVNFVAAIDVYEDGEAGLLLCYNCECPGGPDCGGRGPGRDSPRKSWQPLRQAAVCDRSLSLSLSDICYYRKVCPFNGGSPLVQASASDFHFSWNQVPYAIGKNQAPVSFQRNPRLWPRCLVALLSSSLRFLCPPILPRHLGLALLSRPQVLF